MEVTEHIIRGRLRCGVIVLIFRINVQAIGKEVQVEVLEVSFSEFNVELQLLLIQALEEVHSWAEVEIDFGKDITIGIDFDVLKGKLLNNRLLAIQVTNTALEKHISQDVIFLVLARYFIDHPMPVLIFVDFLSQNCSISVQIEYFLHWRWFFRQ